jgi:hypothetical protein
MTTNPRRARVKSSLIGTCNTPLERSFEGYKILFSLHVPKRFYFRKIYVSKVSRQQTSQFWGSHLGILKKMPFGCNPAEKHKIYYREGSDASSQRIRVV